jgi:hypothetical protein
MNAELLDSMAVKYQRDPSEKMGSTLHLMEDDNVFSPEGPCGSPSDGSGTRGGFFMFASSFLLTFLLLLDDRFHP